MYKNLFAVLSIVITISFSSCNKKDNSNPRLRVINTSRDTVSVVIQNSYGSIIYKNQLLPSLFDDYKSYSPDKITINITQGGYKYKIPGELAKGIDHDITIDQEGISTHVKSQNID